MAKKNTKKTTKKETIVDNKQVEETVKTEETVVEETNNEEVNQELVSENGLQLDNNDYLFTMDVSMYGIKKDDAEKLVNTAIKFYFENKDKVLVESEPDSKEVVDENKLLNIIVDYEKTLKLFNYVPKAKVVSFLKTLKENL